MRTLKQEYVEVVQWAGRVTANRFLHAKLRQAERDYTLTLSDFYAAHAPSVEPLTDEQRENEERAFAAFDPFGWNRLYARDQWAHAATMQFATNDGELIKAFCKMDAQWRYFVAAYVLVMTGEQRREAMLAALDVTPENEPFLEALHDLSESETFAADRVALHIFITGKWPEPGTPEAEELMECAQ